MNKNAHDWEKTGLLYGVYHRQKETCSFMLEEAYQFLKDKESTNPKIESLFFPIVLRLFDFASEYVSLDHGQLYDIVSEVKEEIESENFVFTETALIHESCNRYKKQNFDQFET